FSMTDRLTGGTTNGFSPETGASELDRLQHLSRMTPRGFGNVRARQHSCNLLHPSSPVKPFDAHLGPVNGHFLSNQKVGIREASYLGLMGNTQHLIGLGQTLQFRANRFAYTASDSRIDFVEHNGSREPAGAGDRLEH